MCSDAANGEYEGFKVRHEAKCSLKGEATTSESRLHLNDILEELIRLDQQGIFMNPVDESIAPDYSKVIENPMCFLRMREKINAGQYTAWASIVEDFERICYNALKYNKKRSRIWNAANLMLRQGKRYLDQQYSKQGLLLGLNTMRGRGDHHDKIEAKAKFGRAELDVPIARNPGEQVHGTANENLERTVEESQDQLTKESSIVISEMDATEQKGATRSPAKSSSDVSIEILNPVSEEDFRRIFDDQATECSSSFSSTHSELEDESSDVDSEFRDGNGANAPTEDVSVTSRRRKRALDVNWKMYRQGIEWRCRWLELRIKRLEAESNKYERILETTETRKGQQKQDGSVARSSEIGLNIHKCRVFRRRRRRRAEESGDAMLQMSLHPVFSRYEKQKQRNQEMSSEEGVRDENQQILEFDDFDFEFDNDYEDNIVLEKDSYEQYLWQIEGLQTHICDLKEQLIMGATVPEIPKNPISEFEALQTVAGPSTRVQSPGGLGGRSVIRDLKSHGGTPSSRRRNSDFDINNVIMPDSVMANYVEPVRHAFIETPHWRWLKAESAARDEEEEVSDEDTDDEAYITRHSKMQSMEREQQYSPLTLNRSRNLSSAKERPKSSNAGRGPALPNSFGYIPKKKRKKRVSREITVMRQDSQPT